jgi:hypothetical protein
MAKHLGEDDLLMTKAFKSANSFDTPASYFRSSTPITGCFTTQGIDVANVYASAHQARAEDHRYWIIDLCSKLILGASYPHLVRPRGRRLKCVVERTAKRYTKRLHQLCNRHLMFSKMELLLESAGVVENADLCHENVQHKYCVENNCNHFMTDDLEFSPEVDFWIKRHDLYSQPQSIRQRQRAGKRVPLSHFLCSCENNNISRPLSLTDEEIKGLISHCKQWLIELEPVALPLQNDEHLNKCLADATQRRQHKCIRRIKEIIRNKGKGTSGV